jgi:hypothetical protein
MRPLRFRQTRSGFEQGVRHCSVSPENAFLSISLAGRDAAVVDPTTTPYHSDMRWHVSTTSRRIFRCAPSGRRHKLCQTAGQTRAPFRRRVSKQFVLLASCMASAFFRGSRSLVGHQPGLRCDLANRSVPEKTARAQAVSF